MHEISEWEAYYDNNKTVDIRSDSPTSYFSSEEQAGAGAARGRAEKFVVETTEHHPEHPQHRVTTDVPLTQTVAANDVEAAAPGGMIDPAAREESQEEPSEPVPNSANFETIVTHEPSTHDPTTHEQPTHEPSPSEDDLLPCHYFDFMYGTSTGGLISTILGRLRMTVPEALELYRKVGDDLFGVRRSRVPLRTKYYHEPLEKAVREIVRSRCKVHEDCDGNDLHPWEFDQASFDVDQPRVCQSCCLTATHDQSLCEAHLLRSYPHYYSENAPNWITRYNEGADALPIWQVTRATTAAPFYFEMLKAVVNDVEMSFKDGGIRENNPSGAAISEFHALYEGRATSPAILLSVGTGRPDQTHDGFAAPWPTTIGRFPLVSKFLEKRAVVQNLLIKYTEGEKQHKQMREHAKGEHTWYKRLNVSKGFEDMPLDHWEEGLWTDPTTGQEKRINGGTSLTKMEEAVEEELNRPFNPEIDSYAPPSTMLKQAAQKLVLQRRAREAEGGPRWDVFVGGHQQLSEPKS